MTWQPRRIDLPTVWNLRDVGGARAGTTRVQPGVLLRSTQLAGASDADQGALRELGVARVVDLRTAGEVEQAPDRHVGEYQWLDVLADSEMASQASMAPLFEDPKKFEQFLTDGTAVAYMRQAYLEFVDLASAQRAYGDWLRSLAATDGATLVHCTNGKDRTGWAVALALLTVGVDRDDVFTDYLTTNDQYLPALQPVLDQVAEKGLDPALLKPVLGVREEYLASTLDRVTSIGGLETYLELIGVGSDTRGQLERALLG